MTNWKEITHNIQLRLLNFPPTVDSVLLLLSCFLGGGGLGWKVPLHVQVGHFHMSICLRA